MKNKNKKVVDTTATNNYDNPVLMYINNLVNSVEMIYKETALVVKPTQLPLEKISKVVYSIINGKWNMSAPIYGTIVPKVDEYYIF